MTYDFDSSTRTGSTAGGTTPANGASAGNGSSLPEVRMRARVEAAGGQLIGPGEALVEMFGYDELSDSNLSAVRFRMEKVGVAVSDLLPPADKPQVTLSLQDRADDEWRPEDPAPQATPPPQPPVAEPVAESAAAFGAVATGAIATGLLFVALGLAGHWIYGLLYTAFTVMTVGLLRWRLPWFARLFVPRVPFVRLGFSLGAFTMFLVAVVAGVLVMTPIAAVRGAAQDERDAKRELVLTNAAIKDGDLKEAQVHLDRAKDNDSGVAGLSATEDRFRAERQRQQDEASNKRAYAQAEQAIANDEYDDAISAMENLDYRDSAARATAFRAEASSELLGQARGALKRSAPQAVALGVRADDFRSTRQTRSFLTRARGVLRDRRARARAIRRQRAEARAQARRERRAAAKVRREQAAAQRQAEEAEARRLEEEQFAPPPATPAPDTGGGNWCGKRDGDGDGIYCEGE